MYFISKTNISILELKYLFTVRKEIFILEIEY